jgi:hypothetical protein
MVIARDRRSGVSRSIPRWFHPTPDATPPEPGPPCWRGGYAILEGPGWACIFHDHLCAMCRSALSGRLMGLQIAALLKLNTPDAMPNSYANILRCQRSPSGKPDWGSGLCDLGSAALGIRQPWAVQTSAISCAMFARFMRGRAPRPVSSERAQRDIDLSTSKSSGERRAQPLAKLRKALDGLVAEHETNVPWCHRLAPGGHRRRGHPLREQPT